MKPTSYILPVRTDTAVDDELILYLRGLARVCEVLVVDGSPAAVFDSFAARCGDGVVHLRPDADLQNLANGKVAGVLTGLRRASHESIVIADDDVRYDITALEAVVSRLDRYHVVRPQNYFAPLPWHAYVDTARSLINRVTGGDWPGTLAVRRSTLVGTGGYDGNVLFENLELVRTVQAAGGVEGVARDVYVRRAPPDARWFFAQRVRQAYDEFARPARLAVWLSVLPVLAAVGQIHGRKGVAAVLAVSIVLAELGRRVDGGTRVFPLGASLVAPLWLLERAVAAWLAVATRIARGGVAYRGRILKAAATPVRQLRRRHAAGASVHSADTGISLGESTKHDPEATAALASARRKRGLQSSAASVR